MKKLTESQLRDLIRNELSAHKVTKRGEAMTEARANYLAENIINELGIFAAIGAGLKGLMAGGGAAGKALGNAATKALVPIGKAAAAMKNQASAAIKSVDEFVSNIADEAVKSAVEARRETIKTSVEGTIKKAAAEGMRDLMNLKAADGSPLFDEASAKTLMTNMIMDGIAQAMGGK